MDTNRFAIDMLRSEILEVIHRYGVDHGITVFEAIGVLELVKLDSVKMLEDARS